MFRHEAKKYKYFIINHIFFFKCTITLLFELFFKLKTEHDMQHMLEKRHVVRIPSIKHCLQLAPLRTENTFV